MPCTQVLALLCLFVGCTGLCRGAEPDEPRPAEFSRMDEEAGGVDYSDLPRDELLRRVAAAESEQQKLGARIDQSVEQLGREVTRLKAVEEQQQRLSTEVAALRAAADSSEGPPSGWGAPLAPRLRAAASPALSCSVGRLTGLSLQLPSSASPRATTSRQEAERKVERVASMADLPYPTLPRPSPHRAKSTRTSSSAPSTLTAESGAELAAFARAQLASQMRRC